MPFYEPVSDIPGPYREEAADWRQIWALAAAADTAMADLENDLSFAARPPSFLLRQTADSSSITSGQLVLSGFTAEWLGAGSFTNSSWLQPRYEPPSRYTLGMFAQTKTTAGAAGAATPILAGVGMSTVDPITGLTSNWTPGINVPWWGTLETNSGGDYVTLQYVPQVILYQANVTGYVAISTSGTASRAVAAGARLWGWRLGDA